MQPSTVVDPVDIQSSAVPSAGRETTRYALLDAIKGLAACVVVWHHLTCYAPGSDLADLTAPRLRAWLYDEATFLVQIFFVISGFAMVMAQPLQPLSWWSALRVLFARYVRLATPYLVMLALLLLAGWLTRESQIKPVLVSTFSWEKTWAHLFFLQDILGFGNYSAGTWYVCIDMQYALLFLSLSVLVNQIERIGFLPCSTTHVLGGALATLGLISMWYWNREPKMDRYVIYFLSSIVLGSLLAWTLHGRLPLWMILFYSVSMVASLVVEYRPRLLVALVVAVLIAIGLSYFPKLPVPGWLRWLGRISYSLFLIHYLVDGLVLMAVNPWIGTSPVRALLAEILAFLCSVGAADVLYRTVEVPTHRWLKKLRSGSSSRQIPVDVVGVQSQVVSLRSTTH